MWNLSSTKTPKTGPQLNNVSGPAPRSGCMQRCGTYVRVAWCRWPINSAMKPTGVASAPRPGPSVPVKRHQVARVTGQWPLRRPEAAPRGSLTGKDGASLTADSGHPSPGGGSAALGHRRAGPRLPIRSNGCGRVAPGGPRRNRHTCLAATAPGRGAHRTLPARRLVQSGVPRGRPRLAGGWSRTPWGRAGQ
jgi:hypothetical protein